MQQKVLKKSTENDTSEIQAQAQNDSQTNQALGKHTGHLTRLCLILSVSFVLLTGPCSVWLIFLFVGGNAAGKISDDVVGLVTVVTGIGVTINHSCNFIFYLMMIPSLRKDLCQKVSININEI